METGGEALTAVSQLLTDTTIMGEDSRFERLVDHYMGEELLTGEEARGRAFLDTLKGIILAGAGGFLSGSISGGIKAGLDSRVRTRSQKAQADAARAEIDLVDFLQGRYNERTMTSLEDGELSGRGSGQEDSLDEGPQSFAPREIDTEVSIESNLKVIEVRIPETANNEWLLKGYDKPHPKEKKNGNTKRSIYRSRLCYHQFTVDDKIGSCTVDALIWEQENGIMVGDDGAVNLKGNATRAHIAQMLEDVIENVIK